MSLVAPSLILAGETGGLHAVGRLGSLAASRILRARLAIALACIGGVVHAWGMATSPGALDDEGTYVAQAWAVEHWGSLAHYTYWYDHPPLGWMQIAAWSWLTGGLGLGAEGSESSAVLAARPLMLLAQMASCLLLYALGRRVGISRPFVVLAVAVFALSPLAVMFHRYVLLDNLATPWLLAAFVFAASPRRSLAAAAGAAACMVAAMLSKETTLVLLPALVWQLWSMSDRRNRRFTMSVFGGLVVTLLAVYPLLALLKNELVPGDDHVSLLGSIGWQLFGRESSGTVLAAGSGARGLVELWLGIDAWLLVAGVVLVPVAFLLPRLRPVALGLLIQVLMPLRPGYLPYPYVIAVLPFAALVLGGVADAAWRRRPARGVPPITATAGLRNPKVAQLRTLAVGGPAGGVARGEHLPARWAGRAALGLRPWPIAVRRGAVVAGVVCFALLGLPGWARGLHDQATVDRTGGLRQAAAWLDDRAARDDVIVVDDSLWVDLVERGHPPANVLWFYKVDLDPAVKLADGWRSIDYVALVDGVTTTEGLPTVQAAIEHGELVASFGTGPDRVTIRKVAA